MKGNISVEVKEQNVMEKIEHYFRRTIHYIEHGIAALTLIVLIICLVSEIVNMAVIPGYFQNLNQYLHNILNIVVGLEFARMLIDTTPASILEVLTLAITRHVILSTESPVANLISVACIAGLFAIRRFLIRRNDLQQELVKEN